MLFPELSRKNTHGMAPSQNFFRGLYRRIRYFNKRPKVFVLGFHKTGTTSLAKALLILGYRVCGFVGNDKSITPTTHTRQDFFESTYKPLLNNYDAFEDTMWFMFYKELVELYPDAKFILSIRNEEQWYKSMAKHFGGYNRELFHWIYDGIGDPLEDKDLYISKYKKHNDDVIQFFKEQEKDLLVMNMPEDFRWEVLCDFLEFKKPLFGEFPHANSVSTRNTLSRKIIDFLKGKYYRYNLE